MITAVGYVRMSSEKQEASPQQQKDEINRLAKRDRYRVLRWYVDEGISGSEKDRPEFQRLIADAEAKGDFQVILVWDQDRFSRFDPLEANYYWFRLRTAGVRIVSINQGPLDFEDLAGWLCASVVQHGKAQFLRDLARNVLRGRLAKAARGEWAHGGVPYAYRVVNGKFVLGPDDEVETVRWLFVQFVETDTSLSDLAHQLNERQIPSPGGKLWTRMSVKRILERQAYTGKAIQFREARGKFFAVEGDRIVPSNGRGRTKPNGTWMEMECPAIVSQELFERAKARCKIRKRQKPAAKASNRDLLRGIVHCAHCGAAMNSAAIRSKRHNGAGERFQVYVCSTYSAHGKHLCHRNPVHQDAIMPFLVEKVRETLLAPSNFDRLREEIVRQARNRKQVRPTNLKPLQKRLRELDVDIKAAVAELKRTPDDLYDLAVEDLRCLRVERDRVADQIEAAQAVRASDGKTSSEELADQVLTQLNTLEDRLADDDPRIAREAWNETVERIDVWFDHENGKKKTRSKLVRGRVVLKGTIPSRHTRTRCDVPTHRRVP